jgi:hypothetical protein
MKIFKKPYIYWIFLIFIVYIILNVIFSGFYNTIKSFIIYADTVNWLKLGISIILTLVIGILVSINAVTAFVKYKERQKCRKAVATAGVGTLGGLIVGVCPLCVTGLFPMIFSALGIGFSFASLPFGGIEIQVFIAIILAIGLWIFKKNG